jgi:hypothetical protein
MVAMRSLIGGRRGFGVGNRERGSLLRRTASPIGPEQSRGLLNPLCRSSFLHERAACPERTMVR